MTISLYTLHSSPQEGEFIIQKFDPDYHCESVYALTQSECQCPQGNKPRCRHRTMLPMFLKHEHIGDGWFLEWDTRMWRKPIVDIPEAMGECPSGQRGLTVNQVAQSYDGSTPSSLTTNLLADDTVMGTSAQAGEEPPQVLPAQGAEASSPASPPSPPEGPQPSLSAEAAPARPVGVGAPIVKRRKIP